MEFTSICLSFCHSFYSLDVDHLFQLNHTRNTTSGDRDRIAVSIIGSNKEFNPETQLISAYLEHVDIFFSAKNVPDEKKVPMLLSLVGPKTYDLLRGLLLPVVPKDKTYKKTL